MFLSTLVQKTYGKKRRSKKSSVDLSLLKTGTYLKIFLIKISTSFGITLNLMVLVFAIIQREVLSAAIRKKGLGRLLIFRQFQVFANSAPNGHLDISNCRLLLI